MIGIEHINFDSTDVSNSHTIGSHTLAGDGTLITSTTVGADEGLDVNILNTLGIDVDLDHTEDSVQLGDGTTLITATTVGADHGLDVNLITAVVSVDDNGGSLTVDGTDFDIRDLDHAQDDIRLGDGTTLITATTVGADHGLDTYIINAVLSVDDNGGSLTVDATDLDIRDLDHAQDDIRLGDGTTLMTGTTVGSDHGLDVYVLNSGDVADTAIENTAVTATTTTGALLGAELAARKYLYVQNLGSNVIYVGKAGVTTANGLEMRKGSVAEFRIGPSVSMHKVTATGTADVRVMELS